MSPLILVVEDESALVTLLRYNLEREGFRVAEARDGEEALLAAREQKPDLVLLDWMLPLLSGLEFAERLRAFAPTSHVPVLMLTARGYILSEAQIDRTNIRTVMGKPFAGKQLLEQVHALLADAANGGVARAA